MNDSDLEEAITKRLRAKIEAERLDTPKPGETVAVASDLEPQPPAATGPTHPVFSHVATVGHVTENGEVSARVPKGPSEGELGAGRAESLDRHDLLGEDLTQRYLDIQSAFRKLAADFDEALARLAERGVPVPFPVQNALSSAHREFLKLRRDVVAKLLPHHEGPIEVQRLGGLSDLEELIARVKGRANVSPIVREPEVSVQAKPIPAPVAPVVETAPPVSAPSAVPRVELTPPESLIARWSDEVLAPPPVTPKAVNLQPAPTPAPDSPAPAPAPALPAESSVSPEPSPITQPSARSSDADAILEKAEETIERILRIRVRPGKVLPEWEEALIAARALKRKVLTESDSNLSPETIAVAKGVHPLAALLRLIEETGQIGDVEWGELHAIVEDGLGKPIAMAAARHRFMLDD